MTCYQFLMCTISYCRHRYPPPIIQHAVWLYFRFPLSFRDVEDLLAERGIDVSYETVRRWALKFGLSYAHKLRRSRSRPDRRWRLGEVFVLINGNRMLTLLKKQGYAPDEVVMDKLPSFRAALRDLGMDGKHVTGGRSNNRAENSHLPVRQRERRMP